MNKNSLESMAWKPTIKKSKKKFEWGRLIKMGGSMDSKSVITISHHKTKKGASPFCPIYIHKKLKKVYGEYKYVELYFSNGFLGLKFRNIDSLDSFKVITSSKRKDMIHSSRLIKKIKPKIYFENDLEFDIKHRMLVIPIEIIKEFDREDFDYDFNTNEKFIGGGKRK